MVNPLCLDSRELSPLGSQFWDVFLGVLKEHDQLKDTFNEECVSLINDLEEEVGTVELILIDHW